MPRSRLIAALTWPALSLPLYSAAVAQAIVVGAKDFTEQLLVSEMTTQLLRASGFSIHKGTGFTASGVRSLQESGIIDLYWEYTGTALATLKVTEKLAPGEAYERIKALDAQRGLVWLAPSKVNNTYALAMRRSDAQAKGIATISEEDSGRSGAQIGLPASVPHTRRRAKPTPEGVRVRVRARLCRGYGPRSGLHRASSERD